MIATQGYTMKNGKQATGRFENFLAENFLFLKKTFYFWRKLFRFFENEILILQQKRLQNTT